MFSRVSAGIVFILALFAVEARAQLVLDCNCISTQALMNVTACTGVVPNLCQFTNCFYSIPPGSPLVCSQNPPAGTSVGPGTTPVFINIFDPNSGSSTNCTAFMTVMPPPFQLICPTNQYVACNSTNWSFPPPGLTNACCSSGFVTNLSVVTNWPVITATWTIQSGCGTVASCSQSVFFGGGPPPAGTNCYCLDIFCPSNIIVQTCLGLPGTTSYGVTNIFYPAPWVSNYCIGTITNIACTPPPGTGFPVGTNTVVCTVYDDLGNSASCTFDVIVLGNNFPPTVTCGSNQTVQCGSSWSPNPPTASSPCCTTFNIMQFGGVTNVAGPCQQNIEFWWHVNDCNGNFANCTNYVTIIDTTPPVINCQPPFTVQCNGTNSAGTTGWVPIPPPATDNCCLSPQFPVTLLSAVTNAGGTICNQTILLTWQAMDCCSNVASCSELVTIVDTNPPTLICPPFKTVECGTTWTFDQPTYFDDCCGTNVTLTVLSNITVVSGTCFSIYERFWMATDCCTNNSPVCSQRVIVQDTQPPVMVCPPLTTIQCGSPFIVPTPTATDVCCGPATISGPLLQTNAPTPCVKDIKVTWTATDCCGHSTNCSFFITIVDTTPPNITCGPNQTVQCGNPWSFSTPTVTDNCCTAAGIIVTLANVSTNVINQCTEVVTATWDAQDCCQNHTNCIETVTITDTTPPVINCKPPQTVQCGGSAAGGGWQPVPPSVTDNCCINPAIPVTLLSAVTNAGGTICNQTILLTWQAMDCCSNVASCTELVTITDTNPPVLICAPFKTVECGTPWTFDPPTYFDACCGTNVTLTVLSNTVVGGLCSSVYERFWMATDCCTNNSTVCSQRVLVQDTQPPVMNCPPLTTIQCGSPFVAPPPTVFDVCCGAAYTLSGPFFQTNGLQTCPVDVKVTWSATDCCGNTTNCSYFITIVDTIPPTITCAPNQTVQCGTLWNFAAPTVTDNCCNASSILVGIANTTTNSANPCQQIITVKWGAQDCCGNNAFCTNFVTVVDTLPPTISCVTTVAVVQCGLPIKPPSATDACCGTNVTVTLLGSITNFFNPCRYFVTNTWQATDCCTNSASCTETIMIADTTPPVITCAVNKTAECGSAWSFDPPSAFDACCGNNVTIAVVNTITNPTTCNSTYTRTWIATDCCTNSATCSQTVTVLDTTPPNISCGPNQTVQCGSIFAWPTPVTSDVCCGNAVTLSISNGVITSNCIKVNYRTYTATDCCGNSATCTATVTEVDTAPPVINCGTGYTMQCGNPIIPPTATDNCCPTPTVTWLSATTNVINNCKRVLNITWQATDCCNNSATCTQQVTIQDTTPPVVTCAPNKTIQCGTQIVFDPPTAFDACCGANVTITVQSTSPLFGTPCSSSTTRTWLVSDCCTNSVTCSQTVTVVDTTPPTINCPPSFSVPPNTPWNFGQPTATDACCNNNTIVVMSTITNVAGPCLIVHTRTWKAVDCCGNSSAVCSQSVYTSVSPPPNDLCQNPIPIPLNGPCICGSNICATASAAGDFNIVPCGLSLSTPDVWYTVVAQCTAPMTVDTCQACPPHPTYDTVLSAYTGPCGSLVQVPCVWPQASCNDDKFPCGLRSIITFPAVAGQTYRIRVSGYAGSVGWFCLRATQSIAPPINDQCSGAITVNVGSPAACGSTLCGATPTPSGLLFPTPCGLSVNAPDVWYKYTPTCSGTVIMDTCGTCAPAGTFDTVLSVYTGICPGPLSQVAGGCNDDAGPNGNCPWTLQSYVSFPVTAGVTYYIRVSGYAGLTGDFRLNINQLSTPPVNDLCANATAVNVGTYAWNNCGANTDGPAGPCNPLSDVWFRYTPACSGPVMMSTCGSSLNTVLAVYTGPCGGLGLVTCNDNAGAGSCNGSLQSFVTFNATAGVTYRIRVGTTGATGNGVLNIVGPNPNPTACGAGPITNWKLYLVVGAGNGIPWAWSISTPCCANLQNLNVPGVVGPTPTLATAFANSINAQCPGTAFSFTVFGSTYLVIGTRCGPGAPIILGVGPAGTLPFNQCIVSGTTLPTTGPCSFNPDIYEMPLTGNDANNNGRDDLIDILSGDSADANGNLVPDEVETCYVPEITSKSGAQLVEVGGSATMSVTASGTPTLLYQWLRNGSVIPGATSSSLTINPITAADIGLYSVIVSNACGTAQGTAGELAVQVPYLPVITDANLADGWFRFMVETKIGYNYVIEYKDDLNDPSWTQLTTVPGNGAPQFIYDASPPPVKRFYRVQQQQAGP